MGLFSKKLTSTQEVELQELAKTFYTARQEYEKVLAEVYSKTKDLYYICRNVLQEDRELKAREYLVDLAGDYRHPQYVYRIPEKTADIKKLIAKATDAIRACLEFLTDTQKRMKHIKIASWYPKKYKKAYDLWNEYLGLVIHHFDILTRVLQPPDVLKHDPGHGNDKLNIFVQYLNEIAMFSQEKFIPKDL